MNTFVLSYHRLAPQPLFAGAVEGFEVSDKGFGTTDPQVLPRFTRRVVVDAAELPLHEMAKVTVVFLVSLVVHQKTQIGIQASFLFVRRLARLLLSGLGCQES